MKKILSYLTIQIFLMTFHVNFSSSLAPITEINKTAQESQSNINEIFTYSSGKPTRTNTPRNLLLPLLSFLSAGLSFFLIISSSAFVFISTFSSLSLPPLLFVVPLAFSFPLLLIGSILISQSKNSKLIKRYLYLSSIFFSITLAIAINLSLLTVLPSIQLYQFLTLCLSFLFYSLISLLPFILSFMKKRSKQMSQEEKEPIETSLSKGLSFCIHLSLLLIPVSIIVLSYTFLISLPIIFPLLQSISPWIIIIVILIEAFIFLTSWGFYLFRLIFKTDKASNLYKPKDNVLPQLRTPDTEIALPVEQSTDNLTDKASNLYKPKDNVLPQLRTPDTEIALPVEQSTDNLTDKASNLYKPKDNKLSQTRTLLTDKDLAFIVNYLDSKNTPQNPLDPTTIEFQKDSNDFGFHLEKLPTKSAPLAPSKSPSDLEQAELSSSESLSTVERAPLASSESLSTVERAPLASSESLSDLEPVESDKNLDKKAHQAPLASSESPSVSEPLELASSKSLPDLLNPLKSRKNHNKPPQTRTKTSLEPSSTSKKRSKSKPQPSTFAKFLQDSDTLPLKSFTAIAPEESRKIFYQNIIAFKKTLQNSSDISNSIKLFFDTLVYEFVLKNRQLSINKKVHYTTNILFLTFNIAKQDKLSTESIMFLLKNHPEESKNDLIKKFISTLFIISKSHAQELSTEILKDYRNFACYNLMVKLINLKSTEFGNLPESIKTKRESFSWCHKGSKLDVSA